MKRILLEPVAKLSLRKHMSFQIDLGPRERKSPFFANTVADGVTHFTIYNHMFMPVSYGNPEAEYRRLIEGVSMWDVAAERQVEIIGTDAERLVRYLTPRDLKGCEAGQGRYLPLCDHEGRLINDPILLRLSNDHFWLSIADSDILLWVRAIAEEHGFLVSVYEPDVSPLAIQGPLGEAVAADLLGNWVRDLKYFSFKEVVFDGIPLVVMRSGWSKQGGFELFLRDGSKGAKLWERVKEVGASCQIGPGAPNHIERIESGLLSFGADTLPDSDPFEVGLENLISLNRNDDFVGKKALIRKAMDGPARKLVGVKLDGAPISSNEHPWPAMVGDQFVGMVRAACYSPRRRQNIGLALIDTPYAGLGTTVEITGETHGYVGEIVELPLVKPGTSITKVI